jgi:hypothetical protein
MVSRIAWAISPATPQRGRQTDKESPMRPVTMPPAQMIYTLPQRMGARRKNSSEQAKTSQGADADAARVRALAAYKDFLTLWKDADPDIPVLKQAKAEYAKLM